MGNQEITPEQKKAVKEYLKLSEAERIEVLRFQTEKEWIDTHFFIPVDFGLLGQAKKEYADTTEEDFRGAEKEIYLQYKRREYNLHMLNELMNLEEVNHGKKIFKYFTYKQMADIFIEGTLKKEEVDAPLNVSHGGYLYQIEFATAAERAKRVRKGMLERMEKGETE